MTNCPLPASTNTCDLQTGKIITPAESSSPLGGMISQKRNPQPLLFVLFDVRTFLTSDQSYAFDICLSVACRLAHTCQIMPCSSCRIWMHCKTFSPELTADVELCKSQKSFTWDTHRLHEVSSVLYNPPRLKGFPHFPSLPLCTSQTHISWALRVTSESWLSNLIRNSVWINFKRFIWRAHR